MALLVPVSVGELVDKITILEIKLARITNIASLANVNNELLLLKEIKLNPEPRKEIVAELRKVNEELWDVEDRLRVLEKLREFDEEFIALARSVYILNDKRASIKREINLFTGSDIIEEKSY